MFVQIRGMCAHTRLVEIVLTLAQRAILAQGRAEEALETAEVNLTCVYSCMRTCAEEYAHTRLVEIVLTLAQRAILAQGRAEEALANTTPGGHVEVNLRALMHSNTHRHDCTQA